LRVEEVTQRVRCHEGGKLEGRGVREKRITLFYPWVLEL